MRRALLLFLLAAGCESGTEPPLVFRSVIAQDLSRARTVRFDADGRTFELADRTWNEVVAGGPSAREFPAMAYDSARGQTILFSGDCGACCADTWAWDGAAWTQLQPAMSPPGRRGASMTFDSSRQVLVLAGGSGCSAEVLRDLWEFDGSTWTRRSP